MNFLKDEIVRLYNNHIIFKDILNKEDEKLKDKSLLLKELSLENSEEESLKYLEDFTIENLIKRNQFSFDIVFLMEYFDLFIRLFGTNDLDEDLKNFYETYKSFKYIPMYHIESESNQLKIIDVKKLEITKEKIKEQSLLASANLKQ